MSILWASMELCRRSCILRNSICKPISCLIIPIMFSSPFYLFIFFRGFFPFCWTERQSLFFFLLFFFKQIVGNKKRKKERRKIKASELFDIILAKKIIMRILEMFLNTNRFFSSYLSLIYSIIIITLDCDHF